MNDRLSDATASFTGYPAATQTPTMSVISAKPAMIVLAGAQQFHTDRCEAIFDFMTMAVFAIVTLLPYLLDL